MTTKKPTVKETSRLTITTDSKQEYVVRIKGDPIDLTAALASLMAAEDENNQFRQLMALAIRVVINNDKQKKKKLVVKKKAAPKKKK